MTSLRPMNNEGAYNHDDDITIERRVRVPGPASELISSRLTTKMTQVDARLIAIAKGEIDPDARETREEGLVALDDPFGGLIPVDDDGVALGAIDDEWLVDECTPMPVVPHEIRMNAVPQLCMAATSLVALPLDRRSGFVLSHIDGVRSVEEVVDIANLTADDTLEALAALANLGAITVD